MHSINGLIVNGVSCEKGSRMRLQSGDNITICERVFKFTTGGIEVIAIDVSSASFNTYPDRFLTRWHE